jgi:hypothetical protein
MHQPTEIAARIIDRIESKQWSEDELIEWISTTFSLNENESETTLELIKTGLFRASIIAGGSTYPNNNLDNNELVAAAIKIGLTRLEVKPKKKNWLKRIFGT